MPQGPSGLHARAPTIVPSVSKVQRAELPGSGGVPAPTLEEGEGAVEVWGRFPPPSALAGPVEHWDSHNSCHVTRSVPGGTVCGARLFSRKLCLGGEEPGCRVGAAPGLKQVILHHHQKLLTKTAVESLTGLIPTPPTSCRLSFPFCRGGSPCVPCRTAAGAS